MPAGGPPSWRQYRNRYALSVSCILFSLACAFEQNSVVQREAISKAATKVPFSGWILGRATAHMMVTDGALGPGNLAHGSACSPNNSQRKKRNAPIRSSMAHQKCREQFLYTHPTFRHFHTPASGFRADPFDIDEIEAILDACDREQERNMFQFAFCTGMRPFEYIGQEWTRVNFVMHQLQVAGAFVDGEAKTTAETEAGLRKIDMHEGDLDA